MFIVIINTFNYSSTRNNPSKTLLTRKQKKPATLLPWALRTDMFLLKKVFKINRIYESNKKGYAFKLILNTYLFCRIDEQFIDKSLLRRIECYLYIACLFFQIIK